MGVLGAQHRLGHSTRAVAAPLVVLGSHGLPKAYALPRSQ